MTNEKCSKCGGELKLLDTAQQLIAWPHTRYWASVKVYQCVDCETLHIVDDP